MLLFPHMMTDGSAQLRDGRAEGFERRLSEAQDDIFAAQSLLDSLPETHRPDARQALARIFQAGKTIGELDRMPAGGIDADEVPLLGPEVRNHIRHWHGLHSELMATKKIAAKVTGRHVRKHSGADETLAA